METPTGRGAMPRLQCKRPHMGGGTVLVMQPSTAGDRLNRWPGGHQGRYFEQRERCSKLKAAIKGAGTACPRHRTERSEAEGWGSLGGGTCRFSLEPPSFRRGPVRGPDENGDASPTHWWRSMRWLVPERFRRQGRMWYIQPHSTASLRPSEGAGQRGRAGRVDAEIVWIGVLRQARLPDQLLVSGCSQANACVTLH